MGTVFRAFLGLDIVHRAGKVHSNVDPLLRLPRIPPHQSPAVNETHPISDAIAEQPIKAWESIIKEPALKATFLVVTWEDMMEASPEDFSAWMVMRGKARNTVLKEQRVEKEETGSREKGKGANTWRKVEQRPGQLVVSIARGNISQYVGGYLEDPAFKEHWKASLSTADELVAAHHYYKDEDGLLFFRDANWKARLCVPCSLVRETLQEHHESTWETAHAGAAHLYHCLAYRYYWPSMWKDIAQFCRTCDVCQKIKPDLSGKKGLLRPHRVPQLPWDVVSLDLIMGLPWSQELDAILVIVDKLTKYALYIPTVTTLSQEGFASLFLQYVVQRFSLPLEMIADRDARWAKSFWASIAKHLHLQVLLSTSHHPQHDGQMEHQNQTLEIALCAYVARSKADWAKWLPALAFAYNSTPQSSTGYSPFFLLYGHEPRSPASLAMKDSHKILRPLHNQSPQDFMQELEVHRALARDSLARATSRQARAHDSHHCSEEYEVGDEVLLNPHLLDLVDVKGTGWKLLQ